jgi:hypothetical protein
VSKFKDWFVNEEGTSTADIAGYSRITIPLVRRSFVTDFGKNKKKKYRVPQLEENKKPDSIN